MTTFYDPGPLPGWPIGGPAAKPAAEATEIPTTAGQAIANEEAMPSGPAGGQIEGPPASKATGTGREAQSAGQTAERPTAAAELRVRTLRDVVQSTVLVLQAEEPVLLHEVHDALRAACEAIQGEDLGSSGVTIGQQFEAFFERLRGLVDAHPEPVPTTSLGLPADARFLDDMAEYLTSNYTLDAEE